MKKIFRNITLCLTAATVFLAIGCKDDDETAPDRVQAATGVRFIHSSYAYSASNADLFIDDAKVGSAAFTNASAIVPISSGAHKFAVKTAGGTLISDTTITIQDATQYSVFVKDRSWTTPITLITTVMKPGIVAVPDNSTSAPASGQAKVRFVNMSSQSLNATLGALTFLQVFKTEVATTTATVTQTLGLLNGPMASDYAVFPAGPVTLRVHGAVSLTSFLDPTNTTELTTTLEAGKLYTAYVTSTQYTFKTPTKAPLTLKIIANN